MIPVYISLYQPFSAQALTNNSETGIIVQVKHRMWLIKSKRTILTSLKIYHHQNQEIQVKPLKVNQFNEYSDEI